jgi:hypothetical protein
MFTLSLRRLLATSVAIALAFLTAVQPVLAENCIPTQGAFPPGHWIAHGITVRSELKDDLSVTVLNATGGFDLTISDTGTASGSFSMAGEAFSQSWVEFDDSSSHATFIKTGNLTGTGGLIRIDGLMEAHIEGLIDVAPSTDGDAYSGSGQDLFPFENSFEKDFSSQFSPSQANCNQVFGSLGGPVQYGTEYDGNESYFIAFRAGGTHPREADVQGRLAELMADAQFVMNMDPVDTDVLAQFVLDMLAVESLLVSLEACDVYDEGDLGAAWAMLQSIMFNTIRMFLNAAESGAYSTRDVITAIAIWVQGGSLGWRGETCLEPNTTSDGAMDLFVKFEDVLLCDAYFYSASPPSRSSWRRAARARAGSPRPTAAPATPTAAPATAPAATAPGPARS